MGYTLIFFAEEKMRVALAFAKVTHIFSAKNTCEFGIVLTKRINILTTHHENMPI